MRAPPAAPPARRRIRWLRRPIAAAPIDRPTPTPTVAPSAYGSSRRMAAERRAQAARGVGEGAPSERVGIAERPAALSSAPNGEEARQRRPFVRPPLLNGSVRVYLCVCVYNTPRAISLSLRTSSRFWAVLDTGYIRTTGLFQRKVRVQ